MTTGAMVERYFEVGGIYRLKKLVVLDAEGVWTFHGRRDDLMVVLEKPVFEKAKSVKYYSCYNVSVLLHGVKRTYCYVMNWRSENISDIFEKVKIEP
jgi:hypothetical protein